MNEPAECARPFVSPPSFLIVTMIGSRVPRESRQIRFAVESLGPHSTARDVRISCRDLIDIPDAVELVIIYDGMSIVEDDVALARYGINNQSEIFVVLRG